MRNVGAIVNFQAGGGQVLGSAQNQIIFNVASNTLQSVANNTTTNVYGILKGATVTDGTATINFVNGNVTTTLASRGFNFATANAVGATTSSISALPTYEAISGSGGNAATDNVLITGGTPSPLGETINSFCCKAMASTSAPTLAQ